MRVGFVAGREARKYLRAEKGYHIVVRVRSRATAEYPVGPGTVGGQVAAVDPGGFLPLRDLVALPPERGADGEIHRCREPKLERLGGIDPGHEFLTLQPAREERGLIREPRVVRGAEDPIGSRGARRGWVKARPGRHVERVPQVVHEVVVSKGSSQVHRPAVRRGPEPAGDGVVRHIGVELREVTQRVDLGPGAPTDEARAVRATPPIPVPRSPAEAVPPEGVNL